MDIKQISTKYIIVPLNYENTNKRPKSTVSEASIKSIDHIKNENVAKSIANAIDEVDDPSFILVSYYDVSNKVITFMQKVDNNDKKLIKKSILYLCKFDRQDYLVFKSCDYDLISCFMAGSLCNDSYRIKKVDHFEVYDNELNEKYYIGYVSSYTSK
jgi:hypothetical protein